MKYTNTWIWGGRINDYLYLICIVGENSETHKSNDIIWGRLIIC